MLSLTLFCFGPFVVWLGIELRPCACQASTPPLSPRQSVWVCTTQFIVICLGSYESTSKTQCPEASICSDRTDPPLCPHSVLCPLLCLAFQPLGGIHEGMGKDGSQITVRAQVSHLETVNRFFCILVPSCTVSMNIGRMVPYKWLGAARDKCKYNGTWFSSKLLYGKPQTGRESNEPLCSNLIL